MPRIVRHYHRFEKCRFQLLKLYYSIKAAKEKVLKFALISWSVETSYNVKVFFFYWNTVDRYSVAVLEMESSSIFISRSSWRRGSQTFLALYKMSSFAHAFIVFSQFKPQSGIQNAEPWICVTQDESRKNLAYKLSSCVQNWIIFRDRVWTRKRLPTGRHINF